MGISISGSNSISGLGGSDTNFDKVLEQLKSIESTQLNRLEAWKSDWNLRYEAFTQIIEQIQAASSMLSQLSDKNNFVTKLVQSSNDNVVTAVANAAAQDVQHTIKVSQTASNAIWANTGHIFESKTDSINKTGETQYFSFTYAGERHDFKVPPNTTLESFANMVNNSADNPGIKISLVQTGKGYMFQVAGNDTGEANDLYIHDSKLEGMNSLGSTSNWITNTSLKLDTVLTNPGTYYLDVTSQSGVTKSIAIKGTAKPQEVIDAIKREFPDGTIEGSFDANGNLSLDGVLSISRRASTDKTYTPASTKIDFGAASGSTLAEVGFAADAADKIKFTITLDNGETRTLEASGSTTIDDLYKNIAQAAGNGASFKTSTSGGVTAATFSGIQKIEAEGVGGVEIESSKLSQTNTAASGVKNDMNAALTSANATLTFDATKLGDRIDGKAAGDPATDLVFTIVDKDGNAKNISISSSATNQDLIDKLASEYGISSSTDAQGNVTLDLANVKSVYLAQGSIDEDSQAWSVSVKTTLDIAGPDSNDKSMFYLDPVSGELTVEKAPDLTYTVTTNDGKTGVLTVPSSMTMKDVLIAMQDPTRATADATHNYSWTWTEKDEDGNDVAATPPASLGVRFTDAEGNEIADWENADEVYLNIKDAQVEGPGIKGQISESSNWSIQRSQNAKYQIDNWPVEMESATNQISDVIEGVVFTIQETGEARISISTDITSVEQSIQNFLDAVNSVLLTVNELMKYDETKSVTSSDPNDIGSDNYSPSGLTNQKGSLLTGNYGVQLFKSRFTSVITSSPPGFKSRQSADDILSGDVLASLANLGIKTDTDTTSDTYGLLVLAPNSTISQLQTIDKENYDNLITKNLEAVVDFFCSSGTGSSTSTDFRYGSHVQGVTKAGTYDVTYTVLEDGTITNVMVGGQPAKRDESMPGYYFSVASGDARGLAILIDDLTVGDHPPAGSPVMQVRIKEGLVQTTNNFLKSELIFNDVNISANSTPEQIADAVYLKSQNGALMSLRDNYKKVMESIDVKIEREQRRIDTWYNRQKQIFANLETLLKQYEQQQQSLEGQLKQLSGNS